MISLVSTGFRFSKISVECSVHLCSSPWLTSLNEKIMCKKDHELHANVIISYLIYIQTFQIKSFKSFFIRYLHIKTSVVILSYCSNEKNMMCKQLSYRNSYYYSGSSRMIYELNIYEVCFPMSQYFFSVKQTYLYTRTM